MTQPPPIPPSYPPERRTNAWAISSVILAFFACIPFITSLLAVLFGFIGLRRSRDPRYGLRGVAIAGIIFGVVGFVFWCAIAGSFYAVFHAGTPFRVALQSFVNNLSSGNLSAASAQVSSNISPAQLQQWSAQLRPAGPLRSIDINHTSVNYVNREFTAHLTGTLRFQNNSFPFTATLTQQGQRMVITQFHLGTPAHAPPGMTI